MKKIIFSLIVLSALSLSADENLNFYLREACFGGDLNQVVSLIRRGADVNSADKDGNTPLHRLLMGRPDPDVAKLLIDAKARINARNNSGKTPLGVMLQHRYPDLVKWYRSQGFSE